MALVTIRRSPSVQTSRKTDETQKRDNLDNDVGSRISKSLNECYFANNCSARMLGANDRECSTQRRARAPQPDIQHHLQAMFKLLRPEETLKMAVKLESAHAGRTRFLVVVCRNDEAALLGIDCNERTTVGLVLRVLADTSIKLDGDGGFSVCVCNQQHIFKPMSVQAMWSALQTLHRASGQARELNHFAGGTSHSWCSYYERHVGSDRSCLNEWHAMDCIESRRPPSPDSLRLKPRERDETERVIRCTLKEIMMSVDLDEVTSKVIRGRLEEELDMDLAEYKSFIDQEMLTILGQMDVPTEIFEHVYLGSEWNASNLEELQRNGVRHILNVTREIDNFFPGMFDYLNIRVYDDEKTDLLKHWDNTFKYINKARNDGSKVLVHCKMGISRSASVVIAYAMKAYNWNFDKALKYVKTKRSCIKPNTNFLGQLETYQGILDAMKNKEKLQRSKSETNLKSPKSAAKTEAEAEAEVELRANSWRRCGRAGRGRARAPPRPRSWAPGAAPLPAPPPPPPTSQSLECIASVRHVLMPCANGSYSVSPNQIIRLKEEGAPSVRHIVQEIETAASTDRRDFSRKHQRLNFGGQDAPAPRPDGSAPAQPEASGKPPQASPSRNVSHKRYSHSISHESERIHTWDPGESSWPRADENRIVSDSDNIVKSDSGIIDVKTKTSDAYSNSIDRNLDFEDRRVLDEDGPPPSRQSSWSSFDSAVGPELSRHSSWGSYDTRARSHPAPPARDDPPKRANEKLDERPLKKDDERPTSDLGIISEHTETRGRRCPASRDSVDISANERKFNETCAIFQEQRRAAALGRDGRGAATWSGRLSASVPTWSGRLSASAPAATWARAGLVRRRAAASHGDLPRAAPYAPAATSAGPAPPPLAPGLVSNLKKEFEARSEPADQRRAKARSDPPPAGEDLSVRVLVDRYDQPGRVRCESGSESKFKAPQESLSKKCKLTADAESRRVPTVRSSFCGAGLGPGAGGERPPMAPTVLALAPLDYSNVVSTVMSKAQNKKQLQHGKTHPLTRLNLNRSNNRCSNPLYNTM